MKSIEKSLRKVLNMQRTLKKLKSLEELNELYLSTVIEAFRYKLEKLLNVSIENIALRNNPLKS